MAFRKIRVDDDEILRKKSREIDKIDDKIKELADDMIETMYENDGVGLAAPQIGILKRIVVIDIGEGINVLINPRIVSKKGEQVDIEGCLSVTKYLGRVKRPQKVKVKATDIDGKEIDIEAQDLFARAICHELDHLEGILFTDKATQIVDKADLEGSQ